MTPAPTRISGVTRNRIIKLCRNTTAALRRSLARQSSAASDERAKQRVNAERASGSNKAGQ